MRRLVVATSLAWIALAGEAAAGDRYLPNNPHWFGEDMPVTLRFDSTRENSMPPLPAQHDAVKDAAQTWEDIDCTSFDFSFGSSADYDGFNGADGFNTISYEDPDDELGTGTLAATITPYGDGSINKETVNGIEWRRVLEFDVVFNDGVDFGTPSEIDSPGCSGLTDMQAVAFHEIGHGIGYGHPCESGESCPDSEERNSVMYWSIAACDGKRNPNNYDLTSHSTSYGLGGVSDFAAVGDSNVGGTPLTVQFQPSVLTSAAVTSASWTFGDGGTDETTGTEVAENVYESEGRYNVKVRIEGNHPVCGDFVHEVEKANYVTACNDLVPKFHHSADGRKVRFYSDTEGAAAGCLQVLEWDFGDGETSYVRDPIHTYADGGSYQVVLTARGPAGEVVGDPVTVKTGAGEKGGFFSCSVLGVEATNAAAAAGALIAAVVMSLATLARRRRS